MQETNALTNEGFEAAEFLAGLGAQTPAQPEARPADQADEAEAASGGLEVVFLGEKRVVPASELRALVQKGLNYERLHERTQRLQAELAAARAPEAAPQPGEKSPDAAPQADDRSLVEGWKEALRTSPGLALGELPAEFWQSLAEGESPRHALLAHRERESRRVLAERESALEGLRRELETERSTKRQALESFARSPGSAVSAAAARQEDAFLLGLRESW